MTVGRKELNSLTQGKMGEWSGIALMTVFDVKYDFLKMLKHSAIDTFSS